MNLDDLFEQSRQHLRELEFNSREQEFIFSDYKTSWREHLIWLRDARRFEIEARLDAALFRKTCGVCGKIFWSHRARARWCSQACCRQAYRQRHQLGRWRQP